MKRVGKVLRNALLAAPAIGALGVAGAAAQTNEAGEVIVNTFTLDYTVGTVAQDTITNGDDADPSVGTAFTVDRKVDLDVLSLGDASVVSNEEDVALYFKVTNTGNDNFRYRMTVGNDGANSDTSATDNFDVSDLVLGYVIGSGGTDCAAASYTETFTSGGTVPADVAPDAFVCVRVQGDVPGSRSNGEKAEIDLMALAREPSAWRLESGATAGAALASQDNANSVAGAAQNVFLDSVDGSGKPNGDGEKGTAGTYVVSSAALAASKEVFVLATDGSSCSATGLPASAPTDQFAVPGACVIYTIEVTNSGDETASDIAISDVLPDGVVFKDAAAAGGFASASLSEPAADCAPDSGNSVTCTVALTGGSLATSGAGASGSLVIAAVIAD